MRILVLAIAVLVIGAFAYLYWLGTGGGIEPPSGGSPQAEVADPTAVAKRNARIVEAALDVGVARPKQILFGDLHVHSTFSFDAFQLSLPMAGGDGAHPVADACDYARHCAALDFWSINDHAVTLGPRRWAETVDTIRQCNALSTNPANPDTVAFLGWEWTQVGWTAETHWGHKNVIVRGLEDGAIPTRPISAGIPTGTPDVDTVAPNPLLMGLFAISENDTGGPEFAEYMKETLDFRDCPSGVPVRELPTDCREVAGTPKLLFEKLDDWGLETMVIPHGMTWGFYTPLGSSWDKQLAPGQHDPDRAPIIEIMSGHGNSEEFRPYRGVVFEADGSRSCPEPSEGYLPSCWRAGEIIEERCLSAGEAAEECAQRAAQARQHFVDADRNGGASTVPAYEVADWQDAGQCRDCFQPSFNYRPYSSAQYILSLSKTDASEAEKAAGTDRFRYGFIAASDNHSARPGTGYKEVSRAEFTEARFAHFVKTPLGERPDEDPEPRSQPMDQAFSTAVFSVFETERGASFFLNGGLAAVHSEGRSREQIWDAMQRKEVYGTSGPRILLWFDLLNTPDGRPAPMGSQVALEEPPIFQVRAAGSFEQKPGCPADATSAMAPERIERLCRGECYHPADRRRPITRLEVVRILPQKSPDEDPADLIQDPWKVIRCPGDGSGCRSAFSDPEFATVSRDALYYVRAIEAPSMAVGASPLGCRYDDSGRCVEVDYCSSRPDSDDCLAETEERAWSSPIFVDRRTPAQLALHPES